MHDLDSPTNWRLQLTHPAQTFLDRLTHINGEPISALNHLLGDLNALFVYRDFREMQPYAEVMREILSLTPNPATGWDLGIDMQPMNHLPKPPFLDESLLPFVHVTEEFDVNTGSIRHNYSLRPGPGYNLELEVGERVSHLHVVDRSTSEVRGKLPLFQLVCFDTVPESEVL